MNDDYRTPQALVDAEKRLNEALDGLKRSLDGVEALSGIASAFAEASTANKETVTAFVEASQAFEESSAATMASLESLSQNINEAQVEFADTLSTIRKELQNQKRKMNIILFLIIVPPALAAVYVFLNL